MLRSTLPFKITALVVVMTAVSLLVGLNYFPRVTAAQQTGGEQTAAIIACEGATPAIVPPEGPQTVVDEIREIRRRLAIDVLKSSLWQADQRASSDSVNFDDVLRATVTADDHHRAPARSADGEHLPASFNRHRTEAVDQTAHVSPQDRYALSLRRASLRLDIRAGKSELARRFDEAERLRRLATRLRAEALHAERGMSDHPREPESSPRRNDR